MILCMASYEHLVNPNVATVKKRSGWRSCVRGHLVYKSTRTPTEGEELPCEREEGNDKDLYTVAVLRENIVVRHVPRRISAACSFFLRWVGRVHCIVTGARRYSADLPQGGLEAP